MGESKMKNILILAGLILGATAHADERFFSYVHEAEALPKGAMEFEQWATNSFGKDKGFYSTWLVREEFEAGLTENLTAAFYLNFSSKFVSVTDEDPLSP